MENVDIIKEIVLPISLAIIMFSVGLPLTTADFKRVAVQPKDFMIGAVSQIILLPLVAFILLSIWDIQPALAVGVMIIAACPGGATSNMLTYLARGDTALSVSLTAIISLLSLLTLPVIVSYSIDFFMGASTAQELSVGEMIIKIFLITTVPVIMGMMLRNFAPKFAAKWEPFVRVFATLLFVLVIAGAVYNERDNIWDYLKQAGPITLVLNVVMLWLAASLARAGGLGSPQRIAITLECGLQNGTLAIFVAATLIGNTTMMVPGGIYSLLMFGTAILYLLLLRRKSSS